MHKAIIRKSNGKTFSIDFLCCHVDKEETEFYFPENYPFSTTSILNTKIIRIEWDEAIYH